MARPKKQILKVKEPKTKNQMILTIFILVFPVLLLAMTGLVGDITMRIFLFVYEAILIKNFVDDYYQTKE